MGLLVPGVASAAALAAVAAGAGVDPGAGAGSGARPPIVLPPPPLPVVAVLVVPHVDVARLARVGAVGLLVAGAGAHVSRESALAALVLGKTRNSVLGGKPQGTPLIALATAPATGPGAVTIYVELPPAGRRPNARRYPIAIVGGRYRGTLRSPSTRIPGLVAIADVAPTAVALGKRQPSRITSSPAADAPARLARLDARIAAARDASYGGFLAITGATLFLAGLAWLVRAPWLARASLLVAPVTLTTSLALSLAGVGGAGEQLLALSLAAPLGALAAGWLLAGPRRLAVGLLAVLGFHLVVLAARPEVAGLSALGPQPGSGGRFFGLTNAMETLLLVPALLPAALLGLRWLAPIALLALATVGLSRTGADGGGILVLLVGYLVLALRLRGRRIDARAVAIVIVAAVALGAALVGLDALTGGSSHVTTSAGGGPATIVTAVGERLHVSVLKVVHDTGLVIAVVWSIVGLAFAATRRRRSPTLDAFLVAIVASLLVNDSPVHVLAFGVLLTAPLMSWETVRRARRTAA